MRGMTLTSQVWNCLITRAEDLSGVLCIVDSRLSQLTVQSHDVFISVSEQTSLCRQVDVMPAGQIAAVSPEADEKEKKWEGDELQRV